MLEDFGKLFGRIGRYRGGCTRTRRVYPYFDYRGGDDHGVFKCCYGMDDASATPFPCAGDSPNFYIRWIGGDSEYFNEITATKAGKAHTFAVWDVAGLSSSEEPVGRSAEN